MPPSRGPADRRAAHAPPAPPGARPPPAAPVGTRPAPRAGRRSRPDRALRRRTAHSGAAGAGSPRRWRARRAGGLLPGSRKTRRRAGACRATPGSSAPRAGSTSSERADHGQQPPQERGIEPVHADAPRERQQRVQAVRAQRLAPRWSRRPRAAATSSRSRQPVSAREHELRVEQHAHRREQRGEHDLDERAARRAARRRRSGARRRGTTSSSASILGSEQQHGGARRTASSAQLEVAIPARSGRAGTAR